MRHTVMAAFVLMIATVASGDLFLVHTGGDVWKERDVDSLEELVKQFPIGRVVKIVRVDGDGGDVGPDPDPDPGPDTVEGQVQKITEDLIKTDVEYTALLAVLELLNGDDIDEDKLEQGFKAAIGTLAGNETLFPNNQFDEWIDQVLPLADGNVDSDFMDDVYSGVKAASEEGALKNAGLVVLAAKGNTIAIKGVAKLGNRADRLNLPQLIELIKLIIELLKSFDILGAESVSGMQTAPPIVAAVVGGAK